MLLASRPHLSYLFIFCSMADSSLLHLLNGKCSPEHHFGSENMPGICFSPEQQPREQGFDVAHYLFSLHKKKKNTQNQPGLWREETCTTVPAYLQQVIFRVTKIQEMFVIEG